MNDLVEAIIALPENMFYNTGIGTFIWILSNRKEERRKGKIQLIDAGFQSCRFGKCCPVIQWGSFCGFGKSLLHLRPMEEILDSLKALEREADGMMAEIMEGIQ